MVNTKHNKHVNQVRIIGGQCRGRKLTFVSAEGLRPTPDSVREKLFNWLGRDLTGLTVLDLFSGSGALGFEAASRNAAKVVMVDNNRQTVLNLQQINRQLKLGAEIVFSDGLTYLKDCGEQFDVVFLDPPYVWQDWEKLLIVLKEHLKNDAMVYIEAWGLPPIPVWIQEWRSGKAGMSRFKLLKYMQVTE